MVLQAGQPYRNVLASKLQFTNPATDERESALHRISAASRYEKAGDPSRATNLYRAALAGPLRAVTRKDVEALLADCLAHLNGSSPAKGAKVSSGP